MNLSLELTLNLKVKVSLGRPTLRLREIGGQI